MTSDTATTTIKDIPIVGVDDGLRSRKFMLACFFAVVSSAGLFFDKLGGGEFVAVVTLVPRNLFRWQCRTSLRPKEGD